jgi:hypothetical protein
MEDTYENYMIDLIRFKKDEYIANTGLHNYKLAVELIFNYAIFNVHWFVLNEERFNEVYDRKISDAIDKFLKQGGKIYFYIGKCSDNSEFLDYISSLLKTYNEQIVCVYKNCRVTTKTYRIFSSERTPCEWITFDDRGYRYSPEADKYRAIFCANDKEKTYELNQQYLPKQ